MFGYTLKLVKKKDVQQCKLFKKSVIGIDDKCKQLRRFLIDRFDIINADDIGELVMYVDSISTYTDIYANNKYSSPSAVLGLSDIMKKMQEFIPRFIEIHSLLNESEQKMEYVNDNKDSCEDVDELNMEYECIKSQTEELVSDMVGELVCVTKIINRIVNSDIIKIESDVDIIHEYRKREKMLSKQEPFETKFTVNYGIMTPSDIEFIKRRNVK